MKRQHSDNPVIEALLDPRCYPHPVKQCTLIETHISWLILTGDYAYKIKKPVALGFLDFSTLSRRRHFCEEELRLNRRLAERLYLDVVRIVADGPRLRIADEGQAIEYAVRMRQFDTRQQLDQCLDRGQLTLSHCLELGQRLAAFHDQCPAAPAGQDWGREAVVRAAVAANFDECRQRCPSHAQQALLTQLQRWSDEQGQRLAGLFSQRRQQGHVRECHGDLHLANIALIDGQVTPFDCLEFSPSLRWIDTINEIAFLTMDLHSRNAPALAIQTLNAYLEHSGDYAGLPLLRYYEVYRAMVRAKVAAIRADQIDADHAGPDDEVDRYLHLACRRSRSPRPCLIITHGLSGSGKSLVSGKLLERNELIRIRADRERKRLFADPDNRYTPAATEATYEYLLTTTRALLRHRISTLVDATFLDRQRRDAFRRLAHACRVPFVILATEAPETLLRQWIIERQQANNDPSEATLAVLSEQIRRQQPLTDDEQAHVIRVDTRHPVDVDQLQYRLLDIVNAQSARLPDDDGPGQVE